MIPSGRNLKRKRLKARPTAREKTKKRPSRIFEKIAGTFDFFFCFFGVSSSMMLFSADQLMALEPINIISKRLITPLTMGMSNFG